MNDLSAYCFLREQTSSPDDYKTTFGYEKHDRGSRFFLIFEAILQSFNIMNRNRRIYMADNIMDRINNDEYIQTQLRQNSWIGEIDHPAPIYDGQDLTVQRISNPDPKLSSHFIRRPRLVGNLLEATIQTDSSNENGMNMAIKIVDGLIIPAFSARVLGQLINKGGRPIVNVRKLITYDWVLYQSHKEAVGKISQPITESTNDPELLESIKHIEDGTGTILFLKELAQMAAHSSKETEWLCESFGLTVDDIIGVTESGNSVVIQENKNIYVQPLSDKRIRAKTKSIVTDWLNQ